MRKFLSLGRKMLTEQLSKRLYLENKMRAKPKTPLVERLPHSEGWDGEA
jgi:hypothetical protein